MVDFDKNKLITECLQSSSGVRHYVHDRMTITVNPAPTLTRGLDFMDIQLGDRFVGSAEAVKYLVTHAPKVTQLASNLVEAGDLQVTTYDKGAAKLVAKRMEDVSAGRTDEWLFWLQADVVARETGFDFTICMADCVTADDVQTLIDMAIRAYERYDETSKQNS